ncbi:MAG: penicillin acylase family protein, partial [Calditrichaeota bacterium]|nr:penicillin acylase family protein [Calditrichota bacterium]
MRHWLTRIFVGVLIVGVGTGAVCRLFLRVPQPQMAGQVSVAGIHGPVKIVRDELGIPHISAGSEYDLFFGLGYVFAQDRLWQLDFFRRLGYGRLAEVLGEKAARYDSLFVILHLGDVAKAVLDELSDEGRLVLQAYADGVNACIEERGSKLPLEFGLLGYRPAPWKPTDSIVCARVMAWFLSFGWIVDPVYTALVDSLGYTRVAEIAPEPGSLGPRNLVQRPGHVYWSALDLADLQAGVRPRRWVGSNNWAISGSRTLSGKPILANDPHLPFMVPGFWYAVVLDGPDLHVAGAAIPGTPGVTSGRNRAVAWGVTNGMIDDADLFFEKLSPDSSQVLGPHGWEPTQVFLDTVRIKGKGEVRFRTVWTPRGPIVSHLLHDSTHVLSLRWSGFDPSREVDAMLGLARSHSVAEAIRALRLFGVPAQNFVLADTAGNIAYKLVGRIPARNGSGLLPRRAWVAEQNWHGWLPYEKNPEVRNPPDGFVGSANYIPPGAKNLGYLSCYWEPPARVDRIRELLAERKDWNDSLVARMQLDTVSLYARRFLQVALPHLPLDSLTRQEKDFALLLQQWDGRMGAESLEAAVYAVFLTELVRATFRDEMGDSLFARFVELPNVAMRVIVRLLSKGNSRWFDDVGTERREG